MYEIELWKRKGGGGHGSSGHSGSSHSGGSSESSSSTHSSSSGSTPAHAKGATSSFSSSHAAQAFSLSSGKSKVQAQAYSDGGGKPYVLDSTSSFPGRQAGGGSRTSIYGTSRFGSGYPYGGYGSYINDRPLPYVFYPVPVQHGYYGGDEYLVSDDKRPGGNLAVAIVQQANLTNPPTYRIVGDNSSVISVFEALVSNCSVANNSGSIFRYSPSPNTYPLPTQVIQWYRASSFALSLDSYNNSAASIANMPSSNSSAALPLSQDTPLPSGLNTTFLSCLNTTIAASVPLVVPSQPHRLSEAEISGIVIGSIFGIAILVLTIWTCFGNQFQECGHRIRKRYRKVETRNAKEFDDSSSVASSVA